MPAAGVLNTDNMSILGLTIDYGPYAFMDRSASANHLNALLALEPAVSTACIAGVLACSYLSIVIQRRTCQRRSLGPH